jgi:DNA-binding winged helix-turn-helix (wHTH) protein
MEFANNRVRGAAGRWPMSTGERENLTYEFGPFRLDPAERLLLREGQVVPLTPKALNLLVYLVEHHGRLVEKQTLMHALWPDTIVEEGNLAYNVSVLRKVLDDEADSALMIQTVPTRGYRFVAPVTISSPTPRESNAAAGPSIDEAQSAVATARRRTAVAVAFLLLLAGAASLLLWDRWTMPIRLRRRAMPG